MVTVGELFRKNREKQGIKLDQVEKDIKIRAKFLAAIENNDWSEFSSKIYITGIIKNYSKFLGLDYHKMLAFFRRDYEKHEDMRFKKRIETGGLKPQTKSVITAVIVALFIAFGLYFVYQIRLFITPPALEIVAPAETTFRSVEQIQIIGKTEKDATVLVFGDTVLQNKEGTFSYAFPLKKGKNDFVVTARGANGKETTIKKTYILE